MLSEGSESVVNLRHKSLNSHLRSSRSASMIGLNSLQIPSEMSSFAKV